MTKREARTVSSNEYVKNGETGPIGRYVCANCIGDTDFYPASRRKASVFRNAPFAEILFGKS